MDNPFGKSDPFGSMNSANPFASPKEESGGGLFGGLGGGIDLDAMMRDIDKKIAELDAEEARQKEEQAKLKETKPKEEITLPEIREISDNKIDMPNISPLSLDEVKVEENKLSQELNTQKDFTDIVKSDNEYMSDGLSPYSEKTIKDVEPVDMGAKLPPITGEPNHVIQYTSNTVDDFNIFNSDFGTDVNKRSVNEISIGNEKANIAVATSSPIDEDDFTFDNLPKVENASIIQPIYNSGTIVKPESTNDYNIYNDVPNIMQTIKNEEQPVVENKNYVDSVEISKDKLSNVTERLNDYNVYNKPVQSTNNDVRDVKPVTVKPVEIPEDKTNINVDPDKIVINSNSPISDDEFFDDFFEDE